MRLTVFILLLPLSLASCGGKKNKEPEITLSAAKLLYPVSNDPCPDGVVTSETESRVTFKWEEVMGAAYYELSVKNLLTGASFSVLSNFEQTAVTLLRSTPYSWFVTAKSKNTSSVSEVFKFYNSGDGQSSYAPYPANIISPYLAEELNTTAKVTLKWQGADADQDIAGYDVYFGQNPTPTLIKSNTLDLAVDVVVATGTTYYWKVVTKDLKGNTSDSGVSYFRIK